MYGKELPWQEVTNHTTYSYPPGDRSDSLTEVKWGARERRSLCTEQQGPPKQYAWDKQTFGDRYPEVNQCCPTLIKAHYHGWIEIFYSTPWLWSAADFVLMTQMIEVIWSHLSGSLHLLSELVYVTMHRRRITPDHFISISMLRTCNL